jgi:hypothetical protein
MSGIVDPMDVFFVASEKSLLLLQMNNGSDSKVGFLQFGCLCIFVAMLVAGYWQFYLREVQ